MRERLSSSLLRDPPADLVPRLPSRLVAVDTPEDDEPTMAPIKPPTTGCGSTAAFTVAAAARVTPFRRFEMLAARADVDVTGGAAEAVTPELFLEVRSGLIEKKLLSLASLILRASLATNVCTRACGW